MKLNLIKENEMFDYSGHDDLDLDFGLEDLGTIDDLDVLEDLFEIEDEIEAEVEADLDVFDDDKPKQWEFVCTENNIRNDRMEVAGGWIYRSIAEKSSGSYSSFSTSIGMVFVPHH